MGLAGIMTLGDRSIDAVDVAHARLMHRAAGARRCSIDGAPRQHGRTLLVGDQHARAPGPEADHLAVVLAGRIENVGALREDLRSAGISDPIPDAAALLLSAYRTWGSDAVTRLDGTFAFAIHDARTGTTACGRDRFGVEPLHHARVGDRFAFASDIPWLLAAFPELQRSPDHEVLAHYLAFGFCPSERSALRGIGRIPPGHMMHIDRYGTTWRHRYWSLASTTRAETRSSAAVAADLRARLDETVARSLDAGASVGVLGTQDLPAAALAAIAAARSGVIQTFALGSPASGSPRPGAHHGIALDDATLTEALDLIPRRGEPLAVLGALSMHALTRAAADRVATCFVAAGGEAQFLTDERYGAFEALLRGRPEARNAAARQGFHQTPPFVRDLYAGQVSVLSDNEALSAAGATLAHALMFSPTDDIGPGLEAATPDDAQDLAARADLNHGAPRLLAALDIARHRPGPEFRAPLLDHRLADWCTALPQKLRLATSEGAPAPGGLLRTAVPEARHRQEPRATAIEAGLDHCLRTVLRERLEDTFASRAFRWRGLFCLPWVNSLLNDHLNGKRSGGAQLWALLSLETWFSTVVEGPTARRPVVGLAE